MKPCTRRLLIWTPAVLLLLAVAAATTLFILCRSKSIPAERDLYLPTGSTYEALRDSLGAGPAPMRFRAVFDRYARRIALTEHVHGGHYLLREGMTLVEVARMLRLGQQTPVRVTIHNLKTRAHLAARLATQIEADSAALMAALTDPALAREVGTDSLALYSIFLPDTYEFFWTVAPPEVVRRMRREYDRFWTPQRRERLQQTGLTALEALTLASIVYEETRAVEEMPRIAGVYMNRLRKGMKLQADPTVKYATGDFGLRRILARHTRIDSPYNTYRYAGLPPSPICMPSHAAIDAVLGYERHAYLYFCARPTFDGRHNFAATFRDHMRNARAYHRELNRRRVRS